MASPRQVEPSASAPSSSSEQGRSEIGDPAELRATLETLIVDGERCRARLAAVNPETGQYRVVLRERWPSRTATGYPGSPAARVARAPEARARRFTIRDLLRLERAETTGDPVRSRIVAMLESSRSLAARLEEVDPESGEIRIVLQGALGGFAAEPPTQPSAERDPQEVTRKLKSLIEAATRSS
jgi:hypothetical protein